MREVDDAVRQEQVTGAARRYGLPVAIALVLLLALFGGWLFWQGRQEARMEEQSEALVTAIDELEAGNATLADEELAALEVGAQAGVAASSRLIRAGIAAQKSDNEKALALYEEVAADGDAPRSVPPVRRDPRGGDAVRRARARAWSSTVWVRSPPPTIPGSAVPASWSRWPTSSRARRIRPGRCWSRSPRTRMWPDTLRARVAAAGRPARLRRDRGRRCGPCDNAPGWCSRAFGAVSPPAGRRMILCSF